MEVYDKEIASRLARIRDLDQMIHARVERVGQLMRETESQMIEKECLRAEIEEILATEIKDCFRKAINEPPFVLN